MASRPRRPPKFANTPSSSPKGQISRAVDGDLSPGAGGILDISLKEFLDFDPRPAFVINPNLSLQSQALDLVYSNDAFQSNHLLVTSLAQESTPTLALKRSISEFRAWLKDTSQDEIPDSSLVDSHSFGGFIWTPISIRQWTIFSGTSSTETRGASNSPWSESQNPKAISQREDAPKEPQVQRTTSNDIHEKIPPVTPSFVTPGTPDWTLVRPIGELSPHVIFTRSVDWASTPLGDMATWTSEFRQVANLLMANPHPCALFWGDELTMIYNKAYADGVAGNKHPQLMGTGFRGPFTELWDFVSEVFDECVRTGKSVAMRDQMLPMERHGLLEETYFTWSLTPLYGGTQKLQRLYNAPFETTRQTITDRRTRTLLKIGEEVALAKSIGNFWPLILDALMDNEFDFPFALLYSVIDQNDESDTSSMSSEGSHTLKSCILEGALGVPQGHPAAPTKLDLNRSRGGFIPAFRDALKTREPKLLNIHDGTLSESLIEGLNWRGFGEPCKLAVVCPLRPTHGENVLGFLVVGVNPRRPYDEDYKSFIRLLNRQLATSLASITLFEDEIRRGNTEAEAAAIERSRLSEELAVQRGRLQRIAEISPVGMFSIDMEGKILEANDRWYEITGHPRDTSDRMSWIGTISPESRDLCLEGWRRLTVDLLPWSAELKLVKPWYDPNTGAHYDNWMLSAAQPEFSPDGIARSIMGSSTDITLQKRSAKDAEARASLSEQLLARTQEAEALQKQRLKEAEETRRQQNNFIDITSHEMRNPLSAIIQCADSISSSMTELLKTDPATLSPDLATTFKTSVDAAETILLCAQHQKSIVDDILTISKLDSNLLLITPVAIQPVKVVNQALRMFHAECTLNNIHMAFHVLPSIKDSKIDWVMLDSSRLLQVLINLLTNAIKFTKAERRKEINVSIGVYQKPPADVIPNFRYFPTRKERSDVTAAEDWGTGDIIYLYFEVQDTGCGLGESEKSNLFNKFSQASPRTHVHYGGSGLGLFISRQLVELQGGEIGIASEAKEGSTFAFYLKSRKAQSMDSTLVSESKVKTDLESSSRLATDISRLVRGHQDISVSGLVNIGDEPAPPSNVTRSRTPENDTCSWHVLIVEDNLVNQKILAAQIAKLGCTVHVANHGGEALDVLQQTKNYKGKELDGMPLSVILMDLEIPVMDGLTCVRRIREMEAEGMLSGRIPIIAVTANARGEQIANAKDSGMDDVMPKPFRIKQLVPKIQALLHKKPLR